MFFISFDVNNSNILKKNAYTYYRRDVYENF